MTDAAYIHGTNPDEQARLAKLGEMTDASFVRFVAVRPQDKVLDVGSGLGNVARQISLRVTAGEVHGVEQSPAQLDQAQKQKRENLYFQAGDAHTLPFADGVFDVAYCRYLLEHVANPGQVLREMHRVLRPGGRLFVQENNILIHTTDPGCPRFEHLWRQFAELQRQLGGDGEIGKKLFRFLREAGFDKVTPTLEAEVHASGMATYRPWLENLLSIVRYAQPELLQRKLVTQDELRDGLDELSKLIHNSAGCAYFYWNRAVGVKGE